MIDVPVDVRLALEQFAAKVTVPVLRDAPPADVDLLGTGTFFEANGRSYLVTARHVLDGEDLTKIAVPDRPPGPGISTLGRYTRIAPVDPAGMEIDVAILRLDDQERISALKREWRFLTLSDVAQPSESGTFALCGFPSAKLKQKKGLLGGGLLTCYTTRLPTVPAHAKPPVDADIDIFLDYQGHALGSDGKPTQLIPLPGMSGSSVWEYTPPTEGKVWTPDQSAKVVAVQSSYLDDAFARAKRWTYVHKLIQQDDGT